MGKIKRVALAFPLAHPHMTRVTLGIQRYARMHGPWSLAVAPETVGTSLRSLHGWPGDGVIALVNSPREARVAPDVGVPVVNVSGELADSGLPRVTDDQRAIGRMAANHLLERGFRNFGYHGLRGVWFSRERQRGFFDQIKQVGGACSVFDIPSSLSPRWRWHDWAEPLQQWIESLEPPVGVLSASDLRATILVDACEELGLRVPDDVAVLGVNNTPTLCELCQPAVTSVARDGVQTGWQAAALLDRLMAGKPLEHREILVPPEGIVRRGSTDVVAVDDPHLVAAVRFVREHLDEPFGVERLTKVVAVSRRWLEHRFRERLGCTPYAFICRTRVERAKLLLVDPAKPKLMKVAAACGFPDGTRFREVFLRITGMTPTAYRAVHRPRTD